MVEPTTQSELRDALDYMKEQSGSGSKKRKQDRFREVYTASVGLLVAGERYDNAGVGPAVARSATETAFPELAVDDYPTITEAIADGVEGSDADYTTSDLVADLDKLAELSGNEQKERLAELLSKHQEPSLVTLALLDDESFGLGTSAMRGAFFDGTRAERKRAEALTDGTVDFITRAKSGTLPDEPEVFAPFDPQLAKSDSHMPDDLEGWVAQLKLDGYRLLIHISNGQARAYTRRRKDVTHSLPELQEIDWPGGEYILDGEVIAEDGTYASTSSRVGKKAENVTRDVEMEFALFDVVYANGDMTRKPYTIRHGKLQRIDASISDPRVYSLDVSTDISKVKNYAKDNGYEGVIIKKADAPYRLGKRSKYWVKSKNTGETVDVVAVEFIEGEGEASGTLGKIRLQSKDGHEVGHTGSGFTDAERDEVWQNQDEYLGETLEVEGEAFDSGIRFPIFQRWRTDDGEPDTIERIRELLPKA